MKVSPHLYGVVSVSVSILLSACTYTCFYVFYKCRSMQVLYTDGDEEILNLKKEKWQYIDDASESEQVGGCVNILLVV